MDDAHRIASGLRVGLYLDRGGRAGLYYVVTAQNAAGESGPSNTAQARGIAPLRPYWPDLTRLLPAPLLLVALGRSRRRMRWAAPLGVVLLAVAVVCLVGAVPGSRGAAVQGSAAAQAPLPAPQQEPQESLTRVITYTYDPLGRLTGAEYSTGERYEYAYDAVGNRTAYTVTTPLAGTAVTTYTYDAANRLLISSSPHLLSASSPTPGMRGATSSATAPSHTPTTRPGGWCGRSPSPPPSPTPTPPTGCGWPRPWLAP